MAQPDDPGRNYDLLPPLTIKTEDDIRDALFQLWLQDSNCPSSAHKTGGECFDVGHSIRGVYRATLYWVLGEGEAPW